MTTLQADHMAVDPTAAVRMDAVVDFIRGRSDGPRAGATHFFLSTDHPDQHVELPVELVELVLSAATAARKGQDVTVLRRNAQVGTQQAADILGLSRPTVVKLIDSGVLPATVPGTSRRKIRLADVIAYGESLSETRSKFIAESSAEYEEFSEQQVLQALAEVRGRRRSITDG